MERFIEALERSFFERPYSLRTTLKVNGFHPDEDGDFDNDAIKDFIQNAFGTTADISMFSAIETKGADALVFADFDGDNWPTRFNRPFDDIHNEFADHSINVIDLSIIQNLNGGKYELTVREGCCEFKIEDKVRRNRSIEISNYDNGRYIHVRINQRPVRFRRITTDARPINAILEILANFGTIKQITGPMWNDFTRLIGQRPAFFVLRDAAERKWADGKLPTFTDLAWAPGNERYDQAVLPRNAPVPATGDETCGETYDLVTFDEFTPGDHIVHRKTSNNCFKKRTIDRIVESGGKDPMTRESLQPWF